MGSRSLRNFAVNIESTVPQRNSKSRHPSRPSHPEDRQAAHRDGRPQGKPSSSRPHHGKPPHGRAQGGRSHGGQSWIWGRHAVLGALANDRRTFRRLLLARGEEAGLPEDLPIRPEIVDRETIARTLPEGATHQGFALLADPLPEIGVADILTRAEKAPNAIVVMLDQVTDPQNVGAIVRSAAALGALGVVMTEAHAPPLEGALAKAASGALERIPLARVPNLVRALEELKAEGFWVAGLEAEAPKTLADAKLTGRIVLVLGAEGTGLRRLTRERCDWLVRIPLSGVVESLNVSAAAACALYELARLGPGSEKPR